ncbi:MAG: dTDP-4-dehydrorhamnose 3,5-epimerase [Bdellovibrio sp.]|jgi:dTDP-4-dehydrorhamnose 3,5-epimerase
MQIHDFSIMGPKLLTLKKFADERGFFVERYRQDSFKEAGLDINFIQDNFSLSQQNVLRGLHFQFDRPQGKLVTCMQGSLFDVIVDIRKDSPTFGQSLSVTLESKNPQWFWVPPGFAHGFCALEDQTVAYYKVDQYYNAKGEGSLHWADPELAIKWPITKPILSPKDEQAPPFANYVTAPRF